MSEAKSIKEKLMASSQVQPQPPTAKIINFNSKVNNPIVGDNNKITINNTKKTTKNKYPEGCIRFDNIKANYISYLIDRYHDSKKYEMGDEKMNYVIFPSQIKRQYKLGATR